MLESHWGYLFYKELKSWDSSTWFRIWQFQTPGLKAVSSNASLGWTVHFLGWWSGLSERGSLLTSQHFFSSSHLKSTDYTAKCCKVNETELGSTLHGRSWSTKLEANRAPRVKRGLLGNTVLCCIPKHPRSSAANHYWRPRDSV
jgi:hypothetical protein